MQVSIRGRHVSKNEYKVKDEGKMQNIDAHAKLESLIGKVNITLQQRVPKSWNDWEEWMQVEWNKIGGSFNKH